MNRVLKAVVADKSGGRSIGEDISLAGDSSPCGGRRGEANQTDRVAIGIGIVGEYLNGDRTILVNGNAVVLRDWSVVWRRRGVDLNRDGGGNSGATVGDGVLKCIVSSKVQGR